MPATTKQDSIPEKKIIKAFSIRSEWDIKENIPKMYIDFIDTTTGAVLKRIDLIKEKKTKLQSERKELKVKKKKKREKGNRSES